ncbi:MAG: hypothetical protein V2I57_00630 [Xanthomonadales bacterium]|jgi:hypothetical protein|nr:hypothetical protein [Xanthomonadales bacterium]
MRPDESESKAPHPRSGPSAWKRWGRRLLVITVLVEVAWLVVINTALSLPLTQDLLNRAKPEKFQVRWERAWSWYPGQVTAIKPFANGQSRSQQWQASVDRASARIALLPLLAKRVHIQWGEALNADYRQRPRLKPDTDYSGLLAHFPAIDGYDVQPVSERPLPDHRPWTTVLGDVRVTGSHSLWIHRFRAAFDAELGGGLSVVARGGPLEMDIDEIRLRGVRAWVNTDQPMLDGGRIEGRFGFAPFNPRAHKDLSMLRYVIADLELALDTRRLDFIDLFLIDFESVRVRGSGAVEGRLTLDRGTVEPGTELRVDAHDLRVRAFSLDVAGTGDVALTVAEAEAEPLLLDFTFRDLAVRHEADSSPMLRGDALALRLSGNRTLELDPENRDLDRTFAVTLDALTVPDLALFERYVPPAWPLRLFGGEGRLSGRALLGPNVLSVDLRLDSQHAEAGISGYQFATNLEGALRLENPDIRNEVTSLAGTGLRLTESRLRRDAGASVSPWEAEFQIEDGQLALVPSADKAASAASFDLLRYIGQQEARDLLAVSEGELIFEAGVSSLAFLDVLFTGKEPAEVRGDGAIEGRLVLSEGLPAPGTQIDITSKALGVTVLDTVTRGDGTIELTVEEGGSLPDWRLAARVRNGRMRGLGDEAPGIEDVQLLLDALVKDASFEPGDRDFDLRFQVLSAIVPDVSLFNGYLPPDSPLRLSRGAADLALDLRLTENDAQGFVRLLGEGIEVALEDQEFELDLLANLLVIGGRPRDRVFDLAGSTLSIDNVRVRGAEQVFDDEAWSATLLFDRATTTWRQPPVLDLDARVRLSDSRPFVALMENNGGPAFAGRMLTVEDVEGTARLTAADHRIRIPAAELTSDDITVGMKGLVAEAEREGMIFLRWKALNALLKLQEGKRNVDVINTRKTFENYQPPE